MKPLQIDRLAAPRSPLRPRLLSISPLQSVANFDPQRPAAGYDRHHKQRHPTRTYLKDAVFLPQYFRQQQYTTVKVGKIYHTGDGFEDPISWDSDTRETKDAKSPPRDQIVETFPEGDANREFQAIVLDAADPDTYDGTVARKSVEFMEQAASGDKPFFLAVGFRRPHLPYAAPKKYFELYPPERLALPAEPSDHLKDIPAAALTYEPGPTGPDRTTRAAAVRPTMPQSASWTPRSACCWTRWID